ncbi:23S rRNA (uracil(1939)-C(5))-methyltransferase RlmD [Listeria seeligeri]|uniref:23S rRNA (uracil(1939)-C(5))-methyltransferase RlmD n=1 Tax=Listeria seeligeri TaxID=1640 RepID=UPI0001EB7FC5|nr:23S rRNA (uracil(1939)-C(5))-methyltransferase RlmD [Listeria seeligeri]EFS02888.1 23S rRNA (uracil-5-)-methyltransferase RumA [Listeria seeligeri FSL S4-171]MBF2545785.1 23S rRNA (uracil(1939)-C(5))-methyltransferase RlmD [Listeria seeligeri]MBF2631409.1 23S rRNA (uracil(1939)-C(5))-methyltransferase RlmD [Listeria seeligeri]MBF2642528.1 23S rRNA (uracil(1939)-C(5))-methyltransferase RlmD [Listeria seeligeri]MBM5606636.1 23S rRNA (uracil(1939)-C(5))-methyltransferase RlmD [Listeria seelige
MEASLLKKNQSVEITIEDLTHDGNGVGKIDGYPLFIPNTLPGEKVTAKIIKLNKNYGFARMENLEVVSAERVEPPCAVYSKCGGCSLQHLSYVGQLAFKRNQVEETMKRIGKLNVEVKETLGMENPWRYRNKSQVPVGFVNGKLTAGFYQKRSHEIIDMSTCLIQSEQGDFAVQKTREVLAKYGTEPYDEKTGKGDIRHIMTRFAHTTGQLMLVLVTTKDRLPFKEEIIRDLTEQLALTSIVQNINPQKTNVIFGDRTKTLWGKDIIEDTIHGIRFAISARSFYQVNPLQTEVLYQQAIEAAELTGEETVIDAYCGIGSISLCLAKKAKHVYGVEIVDQAIQDARANAELNNLSNTTFETGKAEEVIPTWYKAGIVADVLVVDPPRKGCDEKLLQTILAMKPKKVVYVSCNPGTLARDMKILSDGGYEANQVQPVDMFPMTTHIEAVTVLNLK